MNDKKVDDKNRNEFLVKFGKPIIFEGVEYDSVDLSGMDQLTAEDFFDSSRQFSVSNYITPRPEADPRYCCLLAARASRIPLEFFEGLSLREAVKVRNVVQAFFQSED